MEVKTKTRKPASITGINLSNKDTKNPRIKHYELAYSWQPSVNVKCMERSEL